MISAEINDITTLDVEAIVNASNGIGILGKGVAGAIRRAGGMSIQEEAKRICQDPSRKIIEGDCFKTGAGDLEITGVKAIYHAVTMKFPGSPSSFDSVMKAMEATMSSASKDGIKSIAIPGLGTGIGRLDPIIVAKIMVDIARRYMDMMDIRIVDLNESFIAEVKRLLEKEEL